MRSDSTLITATKPISSLSFWRFVRLKKCMLSGAYPSSVEVTYRPKALMGKAQVLGQIYHLGMERLHQLKKSGQVQTDVFRREIHTLLESEAEKLGKSDGARHLGDIASWSELGLIYDSLMDLCRRTDSTRAASGDGAAIHTEETLRSKDGLVFGQVDAFFVGPNGIELVDYKTGRIEDENGAIKSDYVDQLHFYAYLIYENFGSYPKSLLLKGKDGEVLEVAPSPSRSEELASEMRALLAHYNRMVAGGATVVEFASPKAGACANCDAKAMCPSFWKSVGSLGLEQGTHAVQGVQVGELRPARFGGGSIEVKVIASSIPCERLVITRVFMPKFPNFKNVPGQLIVATGLKVTGTGKPQIAEIGWNGSIVSIGDGNG